MYATWLWSQANLQQLSTGHVPLLDGVVSGATVEDISMHGQRLHTILMRGIKCVAGADATLSALGHLIHLKNKEHFCSLLLPCKNENIIYSLACVFYFNIVVF